MKKYGKYIKNVVLGVLVVESCSWICEVKSMIICLISICFIIHSTRFMGFKFEVSSSYPICIFFKFVNLFSTQTF